MRTVAHRTCRTSAVGADTAPATDRRMAAARTGSQREQHTGTCASHITICSCFVIGLWVQVARVCVCVQAMQPRCMTAAAAAASADSNPSGSSGVSVGGSSSKRQPRGRGRPAARGGAVLPVAVRRCQARGAGATASCRRSVSHPPQLFPVDAGGL